MGSEEPTLPTAHPTLPPNQPQSAIETSKRARSPDVLVLKDDGEEGQEAREDAFTCPITQEMQDPVVAADGHTYEREAFMEWVQSCRTRRVPVESPKTGVVLRSTEVQTNWSLKKVINSYN